MNTFLIKLYDNNKLFVMISLINLSFKLKFQLINFLEIIFEETKIYF